MSAQEQVQRGHYFALVDEADSILIDEARTPLIISGPSAVTKQLYSELQQNVAALVKRQRDECQRLALDAKKSLNRFWGDQEETLTLREKEYDACQRLWLISKGTPCNKVLKRLRENPDIRAAIDKWDLHYYKEQNKQLRADALAELYIIIDERANEYELTEKGTHAWIEGGGKENDFVMLDLGHELVQIDHDDELSDEQKLEKKLKIQEEDALRKERSHNLRQLLRAHLLMEKDVDYIVQENKIVIIDEHTGRMQPGRRFSDGLHQAIEAKECVPIQRETQTYATITLQNYFRLYDRLAGMTGTAITEASEFKEIYKLTVLQIPTYKPCQREDANDEMYMTEREKYTAILNEVKKIHGEGRPILLGTESVEVSEKLSRLFKLNRLDHTVLNAKNHTKEAEIISMAGQERAITIATNMAGRGTDIKLGKGVANKGGLHVVGSTRHQSRRIDRQLRGRGGRLGDPGSSKFFISLEDPLMRLFASPESIRSSMMML
jgi:preprotein translocase subunit SecA